MRRMGAEGTVKASARSRRNRRLADRDPDREAVRLSTRYMGQRPFYAETQCRGPRRVGKGPVQQFASRRDSRGLSTLEGALVS
jgi:hypothetical protein